MIIPMWLTNRLPGIPKEHISSLTHVNTDIKQLPLNYILLEESTFTCITIMRSQQHVKMDMRESLDDYIHLVI